MKMNLKILVLILLLTSSLFLGVVMIRDSHTEKTLYTIDKSNYCFHYANEQYLLHPTQKNLETARFINTQEILGNVRCR